MMNSFIQRHFSLMLALRYLNPLRTYFSIITLICLAGVSLGVMVLIVVLSVMGGLQHEIKGRFLAYAPHVTVNYSPYLGMMAPMGQWRETIACLEKVPGVQTAYPQIEDYVLVDAGGAQKPSMFRAIDTENKAQMAELSPLIVQGTFDLGMGEQAVISSSMASAMRINVGDILRVYAKRNYEDVINAYKVSGKALKKQEAETLAIIKQLWKNTRKEESNIAIATSKIEAVSAIVDKWFSSDSLRKGEETALIEIQEILQGFLKKEGHERIYSAAAKTKYLTALEQIENLDTDKEDLEAFTSVKDLVLPRDLEVVGIYQASRHISSPEIFVPLNIGQELLAFEDSAQGIAVRALEPYNLPPVEAAIKAALPPFDGNDATWVVRNWMENPTISSWVSLMQQERVMISFVLFFITLVSAFCIMAVMFAMAIQRRKEIAVMRALGATPMQVIQVFLWQGFIIGFVGSVLGVVLGLLVLQYRVEIREFLVFFNFDPFPVNFHGVQIPALIDSSEIMIVFVLSFVMVVIASIIPALLTAKQDPAKSLRSL